MSVNANVKGKNETDNGQFQLPWSLTLDSSGDVYVVDRNNARIQKFDPNGNFIDKWSMGSLSPVGIGPSLPTSY